MISHPYVTAAVGVLFSLVCMACGAMAIAQFVKRQEEQKGGGK